MKIFRKIIRWSAVLLVAVVVGAGVLLSTDNLPYTVRIIHTGSMGTAIPTKSLVVIHKGHYEINQPVTFVVNGLVMTHRLIGVSADGTITTKGDANRSVDPWHPPASSIIGGVVASPHQLGMIVYVIGRPLSLVSMLLMIAGLYLCFSKPKPAKTGQLAST